MFSNENHPENKKPNPKGYDFLKNEQDVARLANHIANLTEHMISLTDLLKSMSQEMMVQRRAFNHLKQLIIKSTRDQDEDEEDYLGLN